ncbi:MAG: aminopeptidase P family protein [Proteobacteria bacterium]|nr:aminopeptidase P family protein [Pseudomonadota bacterium]
MPSSIASIQHDREERANAVDERAIRAYRLARVREELARRDYAAIVVTDPINIRYATGTRNMQVWTLHNAARYAFVPLEGPVVLFDFGNCEHLSADIETVDEVRPAVPWYYYDAASDAGAKARKWATQLADLVQLHGSGNRRVAFDLLNPLGAAAIQQHGIEVQEGEEVMQHARLIKSLDEIAAMREAVAACEEGLRRMQAALRPGITENKLWSILHQANIELGGEWLETRLLSSGPRTNPWYQECGERVIEDGDLVSFDTDLIGKHGYSVDMSRSWLTGDRRASDEQRRLYALAHEQIHRNIEVLKPGRTFDEIAQLAWMPPEQFQDQMIGSIAHGVGLCNEYPLIRNRLARSRGAGYPGVVRENMTLCVEAYVGERGGRHGIKLEQQVWVTASGAVPLTTYPFEEALL